MPSEKETAGEMLAFRGRKPRGGYGSVLEPTGVGFHGTLLA